MPSSLPLPPPPLPMPPSPRSPLPPGVAVGFGAPATGGLGSGAGAPEPAPASGGPLPPAGSGDGACGAGAGAGGGGGGAVAITSSSGGVPAPGSMPPISALSGSVASGAGLFSPAVADFFPGAGADPPLTGGGLHSVSGGACVLWSGCWGAGDPAGAPAGRSDFGSCAASPQPDSKPDSGNSADKSIAEITRRLKNTCETIVIVGPSSLPRGRAPQSANLRTRNGLSNRGIVPANSGEIPACRCPDSCSWSRQTLPAR